MEERSWWQKTKDWFSGNVVQPAAKVTKDVTEKVSSAVGAPNPASSQTATELLKTAPEGAQPMLGGRRRKTKKLRRKSKKTRKH